jgi:ankyrin repeat protein
LAQKDFKARPDLASPDQVVTKEKLERWLAEGADITQEFSNAVIADDLDRVKFLVSKGADVNKPDSQGWTPLQSAARQRRDEMIKLLIDLGADVNLGDPKPLVAAVMRDHVPSIKVLLEHGAEINKPGQEGFRPMPLAIAESKYEAAKALMEAGADVNALSGADDLTPLMIAAGQTNPAEGAMFVPGSTRPTDIARGLLDHGANVNEQSKNGVTALMIAATHNNSPMIGLLIDAGADVSLKNSLGQTAADVAAKNGNLEAQQAIMVMSSAKSASAPAAEGAQGSSSQ